MNLDELVPTTSKYLVKEDVGEGMDLTIAKFTRETVGHGADSNERAVMHWKEDMKPMVLNKTNKNRLKKILAATTAKDVIDKTVNVYSDEEVEFGGEIVGGLRLRKANGVAPLVDPDDPDDKIPF